VIANRLYRNVRTADRRRSPHEDLISVRNLAGLTLVAYLCQVTLFGPIRYFLFLTHLQLLWYIPDILGLMCLGALLLKDAPTSPRILIFMAAILFYLVEGYVVSGSTNSVLSTFKALVPLFCGLLLDRSLLTRPLMKAFFFLLLMIAVIGVAYSTVGKMPWSDIQFEGVGVTQQFKGMQWVSGGDIRGFGFGGDEHGAASSIVTLLIFLSFGLRKSHFYFCAIVASIGVFLTTSRTNLLCLLVYVALWTVFDLRRKVSEQPLLNWSLWLSFFAVLMPLAVIGIAFSYTVDSVPRPLLSLWYRGSTIFLAPFELMDRLAPFAIVSGFGLGGFGFGLLQSDLAQYFTTVDNFILFNYFTFGIPYLVFYIYQCRRMLMENDSFKVAIYITTAIYGVTLRGWSDYLFMILVGYSMSIVFRDSATNVAQSVAHTVHAYRLQRRPYAIASRSVGPNRRKWLA
jgi:hypothetical protein